MSYLAQKRKSNHPVAIGFVILLHALLGYALITGLAVNVAKKLLEPIISKNVEELAPPKEEPPPPPPKLEEIPPYVPPPDVTIETSAPPPPTIATQSVAPSPPPMPPAPAPTAIAPPAPPAAIPGTPVQWNGRSTETSEDDYPDASRRAEEQGVTVVTVVLGPEGRVTNCAVATSSGFPRLDEKTCQLALRRWRAKPATQNGQPVATTVRRAVRWQLTDARR